MSVLDAIGNTPLVEIMNIWDSSATGVRIMAKLEGSNPGGSVKDRPALSMLKEAVATGRLTRAKPSWSRPPAIRASAWPWWRRPWASRSS